MSLEIVLAIIIVALALFAGTMLFLVWRDRRRARLSSFFATLPKAPAPARQKRPAQTIVE